MIFWGFKQFRIFVFAVGCFICGIATFAHAQTSVCFESDCVYPELAQTAAQKEKGLMGREQLNENGGMLFVYEQDIRPAFWMKNMNIPLDFVWLDSEAKVVDLHQAVLPCTQDCPSIASRYPVKYVLEISAGSVEKRGIEIGDHAVIKLGEVA